MLTGETLRDVGRTLPWLASAPPGANEPETKAAAVTAGPVERRGELVEAYAAELHDRYATLYPAVHRLVAEFESARSDEIRDPDGDAAVALEAAETYFKRECDELAQLQATWADGAIRPDHRVFDELNRLEDLFGWLVACLQDIRWKLLIAEGVRAPTTGRTFKSGQELVAALDTP